MSVVPETTSNQDHFRPNSTEDDISVDLLASKIIEEEPWVEIPRDEEKVLYVSQFERTFGSIEGSSLLLNVLNLVSTHLNPGLLVLPYLTQICGVTGGFLFLVSLGLINVLSKRMLAYSSEVRHLSNYHSLVSNVLSPKWAKWFDFCQVTFSLGLLAIYHSLASQIIRALGNDFSDKRIEDNWLILLQMILFSAFVLPLCFVKSLKYFRYAAILRVVVFVGILLILVIESSTYGKANWDIATPKWHKSYNFGVFKVVGVIFFACCCHHTLFPPRPDLIYTENPQKGRNIVNASYLTAAFYALFLGLVGYICLTTSTPEIVIFRPALENTFDSMILARIGMLLVLIVSIPMSVFHCRSNIMEALKTPENAKGTREWIAAVAILLLTTIIGYSVSSPVSLINFMACFGGIICGSLILFFPLHLYDKLRSEDKMKPKPGCLRMFIIRWMYVKFTLLGFVSALWVILQFSGALECKHGYNC